MARTYGEGYNSIREKLAKKGLDQLSEALGERFPLSAEFLNYISSNNSLLNRTTVKANSVMPMKGESVYKAANRAFKSSYNGVITTVDLNDIGIKAVLPQRIVAESVTKVLNTSREQQTLDLIPFIKDILSNSILMNVERIEHVKNKNTVLYGYRLYNSYLYDTGNAVEERIVVSTVIQTTENAVGYIFDNIENVTKSQGSPKTKSGVSQTTFSDISTVSQLYNAVKKIDRKIGGLKYNDDTRNKLFYYTETEKGVKYSSRDADYLSAVESGDMQTAQKMVDDAGNVIPLSQRFDTSQQDIRYDARDELTGEDDMWALSEYDDISDVVRRHYTTHSEAIGEVLKNTADIDIAAGKVKNIVSRLMNSRFVGVDSDTKKKPATALHLELENVKNVEPEQVTDRMIDAVRNVIKDAKVEDPTYAALYDDFKTAFSGKYYLTDEQLADLNENGYTLNDFKKAMSGIGTVVDRNKADKSITGGIKGASQLSFEGFNDYSESSIQQLFGINPEQWDEFDYHAPVMMMEAISELKEKREVPLSKMASADDIDYIATQIAAQFTGAVIQEKYNSRRNPYVRDLVDKFEQRKKDAVKKRNEYYQGKMKELREQRDRKIAEQQKKYQTAREEATVRC